MLLDAFNEVFFSYPWLFRPNPLHSASPTNLWKAVPKVWCNSRKKTAGELKKTATESSASGVHRDVVLTSYSKVKLVNNDRFYQSLIYILMFAWQGALTSDNCLKLNVLVWPNQVSVIGRVPVFGGWGKGQQRVWTLWPEMSGCPFSEVSESTSMSHHYAPQKQSVKIDHPYPTCVNF